MGRMLFFFELCFYKNVFLFRCQAEAPNETKKPLPLNRKAVEDFEMGYMEPEKVRRGHTSLRHALTFISNYNAEPTTWTSEKIAEQYKLKPNVVGE